MNLVCTTGLEQGASLKAECPGRCQDIEFSGFVGSNVMGKEKNNNDNFGCLGTDF